MYFNIFIYQSTADKTERHKRKVRISKIKVLTKGYNGRKRKKGRSTKNKQNQMYLHLLPSSGMTPMLTVP
jgi:hypothetical protein